MKLQSLFLMIISLATVSSLVDIHLAYAQSSKGCTGSYCRRIDRYGTVSGGGTLPAELRQRVDYLNAQEHFDEAKILLDQFLEKTQDPDEQAAAHQALADIDARIGELDSASSHLRNAETLYQRSENSQGSNEVREQIQQLQIQQLQIQQLQLQRR